MGNRERQRERGRETTRAGEITSHEGIQAERERETEKKRERSIDGVTDRFWQ